MNFLATYSNTGYQSQVCEIQAIAQQFNHENDHYLTICRATKSISILISNMLFVITVDHKHSPI